MSQSPKPQPSISANITARDISGQVAIGAHQQVSQAVGQAAAPVTAAELAQLHQLFEQLRHQVQGEVDGDRLGSALERVDELETAIAADKPDLTTMAYVRGWFAKHLPTLTGAVTGIVIHPIVGKLVEAAGEMAATEFRDRFGG